MKNIYITLWLGAFLLQGCNDFLEPESQDQIVPKNVKQFKEFLLGEIIQEKTDYSNYLPLMTDDFADQYGAEYEYRNEYWGYYTWQRETENGRNNKTEDDRAWGKLYHFIFMSNIMIDKIPGLEGSDDEKNQLLAEVYFIRAQSYFELVNLYGEPYENEKQAGEALGVPINNEITILNKRYTRSSLLQVYTKIENDLQESIRRFKKVAWEKNVVHPSLDVAYLLASRFYLYKQDYSLAKNYADSVIDNDRYQLYDLPNTTPAEYKWFININNPEIIFCHGFCDFGYVKTYTSTYASYRVSSGLISSFDDNDLRKKTFIDSKNAPQKFSDYNSKCYGNTYRLAEAYLNRAEALIYLDKWETAMSDMNAIRKNRIKGDYRLIATDKEDALSKIRAERRRELCFEKHRWFDLRRYGMPEIKHLFTINGGQQEYTLPAGSKAYTLPIPQKIRRENTIIENVQRPEQQ